jgi:hypothetical protein
MEAKASQMALWDAICSPLWEQCNVKEKTFEGVSIV